ncbi:nucleotidyl transferase AbiEii/AbiGii toxin family protein [Cryobacterium psychrophilum]|uniref:nucleotidyl transferase AbiEii/AbiGii toxin family protein n=1 Tax=Cryobacterium psychrophilum TaxID=41988 RepID=UPI0010ECE236|nr:nucleotidyl transferase AbiEii/AbiGii toxin family protein [Cryobacterium psychrophilum]TDW29794.1 nucleotidyltransferase AbiEii toxin of type IV toxin-antitoxin system [Cryobacterium psychrophilum]
MSDPATIYTALQRLARGQGRATSELLTLYVLERFLERLTLTEYRESFVLKGGVLLAAYRLRRPTRDIDMQAMDFMLDERHLRDVVMEVANVIMDDALVIDTTAIRVEQIRDADEYSGLRVHVPTRVHTARVNLHLDISIGDPIWPAPRLVRLPRLLGGDFAISGHPPETVIAEKAVTVLQRGVTSTGWRDFLDLSSLAGALTFRAGDLRTAAEGVARHRGVSLGPLSDVTAGYGDIAQPKWSAWRRKNELESRCRELFEEQLAEVIAFIDPVFSGAAGDDAVWNRELREWGTSGGGE